ncbi:uncharacterized protein EV420DRAFT_484562 [Desarmillaria tabescens]|uniref:F-box domain-containing protein n=1 Tax=Armillaria tabescens TaxID=1929756 RepID=A0AA39KFM4_ARMTA|nr:uncharacterized protein EV420DRAFT_484562 [Desarmillaria tabescens]KAK0457888.1 hypothetical protein EV420DRAFT_484562 [Desarmillaria tabescens]
MANIYDLPNEILLILIYFLDISDILSLRQTCHLMHAAIQDKSVWTSLLKQQKYQIPFVASLREPHSPYVLGLDASVLQSEVLTARRTDRLWLANRRRPPIKLYPSGNVQLIGLNVFLDKWLLAVYGEGMHLWDLDLNLCSEFPGFRCASLALSKSGFASYTAALDDSNARILIVLKKHSSISPFVTLLYEIPLVSPHFHLVCNIGSNPLYSPRHIDPVHNVVLSSHACSVELLDWTKEDSPPVMITTRGENLEEMYTAIQDVHLFGPYMIVFKTRSIELHPLPSDLRRGLSALQHNLPILKHKFSKTFRSFVISEFTTNEPSDILTLDFLALDVIHGLFHYTIQVTISVPSLQVNLTGLNSLSNLIYRQSPIKPFVLQDAYADPRHTPLYVQESSVFESSPEAPPDVWATREDNAGGFISAYCMGPQAMRAVWMERSRGSMVREIVAARLQCPSEVQDLEEVMSIDARIVHDESSYDLREDFTHCALGEATGRIILGNRAGDLFLLSVDK